jgi:hypothetical protein
MLGQEYSMDFPLGSRSRSTRIALHSNLAQPGKRKAESRLPASPRDENMGIGISSSLPWPWYGGSRPTYLPALFGPVH